MTQTSTAYQITVDGTTLAVEGIRGYFQSRRAGLEAHLATRLATFIDDAHDSLDIAIYDLRHPMILGALARAVARKVRVRIAYDAGKEHSGGMTADPRPDGTEEALANAGLLPYATAVHKQGRHLMHDKFVLRDQRDVWVGSANFTEGGLELQDNTCLTFSSRELAARFAGTFTELLQPHHRHMLSQTSLADAEATAVAVGSTEVVPLFAPAAGESIEQEIVRAIGSAHKIRVMAFLLSDPAILQALAPFAHDPQFDIRGVYDPHGMQDVLRYSQQDPALFWFMRDPRFVAAPSHAFSANREQDFMHNKAVIVDDELVFTGSYNFSENAEANDETMLKIESEPIAAAYAHYSEVLFTAYGGATIAPQRKATTGGPQPRRRMITAPPIHSVAVSQPLPIETLEEREALARERQVATVAADAPAKSPRRALDILITVVRVKIVVLILVLAVYLVLSGIVHL